MIENLRVEFNSKKIQLLPSRQEGDILCMEGNELIATRSGS
ncbi:hypothetical protein SLEP1_g20858 [Rubroshorea leprosula]|uniref:Uncharacterized protein n=1 Tax=Rubroshorea leprosula TaxID=152421 RepID=A0AAV5JD53_9ROSI|nr:hypothetical protein SLEP1_g20858 [Rubroshorea leprosula]